MAASVGTTPGGTTPAAMTPVGASPELEKDVDFQEHEKILSPDFLSVDQITEMLAEDVDGVQQKLEKFLNFKNLQTCLKEAILLDYYVSGFLWARGMDFSIIQYSKFMTLLDMLLHNLRTLRMSLEDSLKWLGEVMAEIGPSHSQKNEAWNIFDVKQANAIIDYLKVSLFQHYKLYEFLFYSPREEIVIGTEQVIEIVKPSGCLFPDPLEEGISFDIYSTFIEPPPTLDTEMKGLDQEQGAVESQPEADTSDTDLLAGFTIEDVKSVLDQVTDDVLISIQWPAAILTGPGSSLAGSSKCHWAWKELGPETEINEKLQIQEEAFNARIEKLKKA
uniref:Ciliary associated calcium binding coiled-coil 1 n=1 Tax=Equus asinus TaxID=9793 RepID=A0A8C4M5D1_EQUAS|nr:ciliary-associated calcium-binding coiled-coil protein 1 isoform X1 [Equus asinus]